VSILFIDLQSYFSSNIISQNSSLNFRAIQSTLALTAGCGLVTDEQQACLSAPRLQIISVLFPTYPLCR